MTTHAETADSEYFLLTRDPDGAYVTAAERIVQERGIPEFTQSLRADGTPPSDFERVILLELQKLLPERVHIPLDSPFLVLRVGTSYGQLAVEADSKCQCWCSGGGTSAGCGVGEPAAEVSAPHPAELAAETGSGTG
ncbi:hypothetical protein [Actinacidiphila acididurans]|uniref:Uncharacterized protein n=1 Tax=Actinacidiphila acididurans TaxID=2784346 RepID=A0ABS2TIG2_9ACTN|nr:hypothetical protein [Actinacidiphila acididurans]MBM9503133.1 hypothetical protein [Actinacidiphila acididurans]